MKVISKLLTRITPGFVILVSSFAISTHAQGTAFTYQGWLNSAGSPVSGSYDFTFTLYATNSGGTALAGPVTNSATAVTNGLFTTLVNLGVVFTGSSNWLEIAVRTNGTGGFTTLGPRNQVTPTPYAISAESVSGGISASQLNGGTIPNSVIAGFQGPSYAAVNGGFGNTATGTYGVVGGGEFNTVNNSSGVVAGGYGNTAGSLASVGGGQENFATGQQATIPGGNNNTASGNFSFAAGDMAQAVNQGAFVWSDSQGTAFSSLTNNSFNVRAGGGARFVTGGAGMTLDGAPVLNISSAPLGITLQQNTNGGPNVIGGSPANYIAPGIYGSVISGGGALFTPNGAQSNSIFGDWDNINGGAGNVISNYVANATIAGGDANTVLGADSAIAGGQNNTIYSGSADSVVGGGEGNVVSAASSGSTIGGGLANSVTGGSSTIPGGYNNLVFGNGSFAAGENAHAVFDGTFVWSDLESSNFQSTAPNQFLIRASGGVGIGINAPQASVDIASTNGVNFPQLRLVQQNTNDFARLRFQSGALLSWDISAGGSADAMNWFVPNNGNVMSLSTNGALTTSALSTAALTTGGLTVTNGGAIHVSGAGQSTGTAAFIQMVTSENLLFGYATFIDNPICNNNPNAILTVTHHYYNDSPDADNNVVTVTYSTPSEPNQFFPGATNKWVIFDTYSTDMQVGYAYNVLVIIP